MAKQASAGELRTLVRFRRVCKGTDGKGAARQREEYVFTDGSGRERAVHCKWVNAHGTEVFTAMQMQIREPATLTMRYSPLIDAAMLVYKGRDPRPYEIISIDNVEDRGKWLEIKVQRKGGGAVMSVEEKIVAALAPFGDPVEGPLLYAAARDLPPRYYTFQCSSGGADFGDDEPGCELWRVSVHYFAPLYNEDIAGRTKRTKQALHRAGFTWPSSTDASDQDGRHIVFECEIAEEVRLDGAIGG